MTRAFIIDTDTASDDAIALIMALRAPDAEVKAITVVAGNVPVAQGARNALYTAELCGVDVPVYCGAGKPLLRPYQDATAFHGADGMGNQHYPAPKGQPQSAHAVDALIATITANPGIILVTLGPLTNIALAVTRAPEIIGQVGRCVVMGGAACTVGNVTPAAEYNIWVDPEAARIVFHSGLPIEMVGWELSRGVYALNAEERAALRALNTPLAHFALDCSTAALEAYCAEIGEDELPLPDPVTMAVALDPGVVTRQGRHYVEVETVSELTRGMTVVDQRGVARRESNRAAWGQLVSRPPNTQVCWALDAPRWKAMLRRALS